MPIHNDNQISPFDDPEVVSGDNYQGQPGGINAPLIDLPPIADSTDVEPDFVVRTIESEIDGVAVVDMPGENAIKRAVPLLAKIPRFIHVTKVWGTEVAHTATGVKLGQ